MQEVVVPAASKFSDLLKGKRSDSEEISTGKRTENILGEDMFAEMMKEITVNNGKFGSGISTAAGISVIDQLKSRLEVLLASPPGEEVGERGTLKNHDMFLEAVLEVLEGDSDSRVYMRTSGALSQLLTLVRRSLTGIREAKEDNRAADCLLHFRSVGKHMKLLAVAISSERSSKLQLLQSDNFLGDLKNITSLGDLPTEVLEGCLLVLFYGLDETCSKMRSGILKDKTILLTLGSALCTLNTRLSKKTKKHKPSAAELPLVASSQRICCQIIKDVLFSDEGKESIASVTAAVVPILGNTLATEENLLESTKKEVIAFVFESLLGCSQIEVLRSAFADPLLDSSSSTIDVLLDLCHEHNWMVSNGLAILMNVTIKDLSGIDIRRVVYDAGATDLCLSILSEEAAESDKSGEGITNYSFVRAAGLLARLSSLADVQEILQSATVYKTLCERLMKNVAMTGSVEEPWVLDERAQLIRVVAAVRDLPQQARDLGFSLSLPQVLVALLPAPRQELNAVTPTSVILPPLQPMHATLLGNIALSLLPYADSMDRLQSIYIGKTLGVERLVCALATCQDIRVRKNIAILLAKGCRDPVIKKKIEHFRGLQMIVELQNKLV